MIHFKTIVSIYFFFIRYKQRQNALIKRTDIPNTSHPIVYRLITKGYFGQRTKYWEEERMKCLTASDVDFLLGTNKYKSKQTVFKNKTTKQSFYSNPHLEHGIKYEKDAISEFEKLTGKKVWELGLVRHPIESWIGASPDGVCETGELIEVKCPVTRPILTAADYEPLGCPIQYYHQVQCQMYCTNLEKCFFIQYKPDPYQILITTVNKNKNWETESLPILKTFWNSVLEYRKQNRFWNEMYPESTLIHIESKNKKQKISMEEMMSFYA